MCYRSVRSSKLRRPHGIYTPLYVRKRTQDHHSVRDLAINTFRRSFAGHRRTLPSPFRRFLVSSDLGRGRSLDDAPGTVGIAPAEYPALPDELLTNPEAGRLDPRRWFLDPSLPFELEIGTGKGSFILQHGAANPNVNMLGIEWEPEIYYYTGDRIRRRGLRNVRLLRADATEFLRWRCPDEVIRVIHLYFSDPWPKKKHHKNRVVQDRFLVEVHRVLSPGGELRVVTDHDELWAWDEAHFGRVTAPDLTKGRPALFERLPFAVPEWAEEGETVGTNYERKMCDGRPPHSCTLRKVPLHPAEHSSPS